ncbi:MAG TPA: hypothetical protein VHC22_02760 [Pirellulales bacterium]|nr:hypothetical protein [Pirellulales bacterium]
MRRCIGSLALLVTLALAGTVDEAQAAGRLAAARAARTAAAEPAVTTASLRTSQPAAPAAVAPAACCCPQPCLIYRQRGHRGGCGCAPPVEVVLTATNPCTCCPVAIPVCIPACCLGDPSVCCHRGFLGANVVDFDWACGYRVTVRFKHNGDVVVVSRG